MTARHFLSAGRWPVDQLIDMPVAILLAERRRLSADVPVGLIFAAYNPSQRRGVPVRLRDVSVAGRVQEAADTVNPYMALHLDGIEFPSRPRGPVLPLSPCL